LISRLVPGMKRMLEDGGQYEGVRDGFRCDR
jgi:hypothetical protein